MKQKNQYQKPKNLFIEKSHCILWKGTSKLRKFSQNNKTYLVNNQNNHEIHGWKVDACLITEGKKCDRLLVDKSTLSAYFVELKYGDLKEAIIQLEASILELFQYLSDYKLNEPDNPIHFVKINARAVLSNSNSLKFQTNYLTRFQKFLKKYNGNFDHSSKEYSETL